MKPIVLALGSNLGDRLAAFNRAVGLLDSKGVRTVRRSRIYWSRPLTDSKQPWYLNAALLVGTSCAPLDLLRRCRSVELQMGRNRKGDGSSRTIDIDLIFYSAVRMDHPELRLPHSAWTQRDFVIRPMIDLGVLPPTQGIPANRILARASRTIDCAAPWPEGG